jgi:uncharacterized membrane protein HdeD (DUF308 family)
MKNLKDIIKKEQFKMSLLYGSVLFLAGLVGMVFPATTKFIVTFCFIFGGSSLMTGLLYFVTHRTKSQSKENEKIKQ